MHFDNHIYWYLLAHKNMRNLIGQLGAHMFIFLKKGRKLLKINNFFAVGNILGESGNQSKLTQ